MRKFYFLFFLVFYQLTNSQSIKNHSINFIGSSTTNNFTILHTSGGEIVVDIATNSNTLEQGFLQTFEHGIFWTGAVNNYWNNQSNWNLSRLPNTQENVYITNASNALILDIKDTINNIIVRENALFNITNNAALVVNNSLKGNLTISSDENSSGVLLVNGSSDGKIIYSRGGLLGNKWSVIASPVKNQKILEFAHGFFNGIRKNTDVSPVRFAVAYYDDALPSNKWVYYTEDSPATETFTIGKSYSMSRNADGSVLFSGTLELNDVTMSVMSQQWTTLGNPYTAYINANKSNSFLSDNSNELDDFYKGIYIWDNTQNKYVAVTNLDANTRSLQPGQGFFIKAKNTSSVNFYKNKRLLQPDNSTSIFNKTQTNPEITISIFDGETKVETYIKYFAETTRGFDPGYDIGNFGGSSFDIFSHLVEDSQGVDFTIQSLSLNDVNNVTIPLGVKASANKTISFSLEKTNFENGIHFYIQDKHTNTLQEIENENDTYQITTTENLNNVGRFYLIVSSQVLSIDNLLANNQNINIYTDKKILNINTNETDDFNLDIYNVLGKKLFSKKISTSKTISKIDLNNFSDGVYIVHVKTEKNYTTKKIILH